MSIQVTDLNGLPDINTVSNTDSRAGDRLATHFFIVKGFKSAMKHVEDDEIQYNGSKNFVSEFQEVKRLLGTVQTGIRDVVNSQFYFLSFHLPAYIAVT